VDNYARDDMRSAARLISMEEREGDLILVPCGESVFGHYYRGTSRVEKYSPRFIGDEAAAERLEGQIADYGRIWFVECRPWEVDPEGTMAAVLERETGLLDRWEFPGIVVTAHSSAGSPGAESTR
ncbi:MAG TPA: hypothetical protein VLA34_04220, partial [Candidatus Krumholzibacterium sp.]|nr:hypothetical protein [Candidatus Krumholzibacterium sp.]